MAGSANCFPSVGVLLGAPQKNESVLFCRFGARMPQPGDRDVTAAVKPPHDGKWWAYATKGFDFRQPDLNTGDLFNRILWKGTMGDDKPYPGAGVQHAAKDPHPEPGTTATDRD
jgi:hypothetical protein